MTNAPGRRRAATTRLPSTSRSARDSAGRSRSPGGRPAHHDCRPLCGRSANATGERRGRGDLRRSRSADARSRRRENAPPRVPGRSRDAGAISPRSPPAAISVASERDPRSRLQRRARRAVAGAGAHPGPLPARRDRDGRALRSGGGRAAVARMLPRRSITCTRGDWPISTCGRRTSSSRRTAR